MTRLITPNFTPFFKKIIKNEEMRLINWINIKKYYNPIENLNINK
jgi:hypothetical protein